MQLQVLVTKCVRSQECATQSTSHFVKPIFNNLLTSHFTLAVHDLLFNINEQCIDV